MMRLMVLLILCALPTTSFAALVQAVAADNSSGSTSLAVTVAATGAGNTLVVSIQLDGSGVTPTGCTDNAGGGSDVYTQRVGNALGSGTNQYFYTATAAAGVTAITCALSGTRDGIIWTAEESCSPGCTYDVSSARYNAASTSYTSNTATTALSGDVGYGMGSMGTTGSTLAVSGSWAALTGTGFTGGEHHDSGGGTASLGGREVFATAGSYAFTGTASVAENIGATVILLKVTGASCTHGGYTSAGASATPNGSSGSYLGKTGAFVTPDCSSVYFWSPALGNFTLN